MVKLNDIPNLITFSRLICCPLWLILYYFDYYYCSIILIAYSAISDYFDGFLARKLNSESIFGKTLDPIADKIFNCTILLTFVSDARANFIIVAIIIIREILISGLREALAIYNQSGVLSVTLISKIKTTFQFIAIFILALMPLSLEYSMKIHQFGTIFLYITAILTIYTGYKYVIKSIIVLKNIKKE
jgi:CDP-diacylglycerol--glycerol-3-phosphate 3-phosphatidyltransferase